MMRSSLAFSALLLTFLTACADSSPDATWPTTDQPVDTAGLVWAVDHTVHLGDGSTIDTKTPILQFVVGGPGVWFTQDLDNASGDVPELMLASSEEVEKTGAHPVLNSLTTSVDGRWLAFLDRTDGGIGPAETVVVDLATGEELIRSDEGLVTASDVDWDDLYGDEPITVAGIVDDTLYVFGLSDAIAFHVPSGRTSRIANEVAYQSDWLQLLRPAFPRWNPSHTWSIPAAESARSRLVSEGGEVITTSRPPTPGPLFEQSHPTWKTWTLDAWVDDTTVAGYTTAAGRDTTAGPALITCTLPTGACEEVEGTELGVQLPQDRRGDALLVPAPRS